MTDINTALTSTARMVEDELARMLSAEAAPESRVFEAMRYATLEGGKRLRPFLLIQSASLFSVSQTSALRAACALEMVHCYSLVHDDLPAMDDDDLRRGRPTVHRAFDEATAILAGDGLLALAFEVLAHRDTHANPAVRTSLIRTLARAAGAHGMVGGQMIDLLADPDDTSMVQVTRLQQMKTGALFTFACEAGAILGNAPDAAFESLRGYAHDLGLAFQIADDLLDADGDEAQAGKALRKDQDRRKATFVALMGTEKARSQARLLAAQAIEHLAIFQEKADLLRAIARFSVDRTG